MNKAASFTVLMAGFMHETNSFAFDRADWSKFNDRGASPSPTQGQAAINELADAQYCMSGFMKHARSRGWDLKASLWCAAGPSSYVTEEAFEHICSEILKDVRRGGFDAIYLDIHGAAMAENAPDAEGELLERIRAITGPDLPIVGSLDLHANVTERMLRLADGLVAYRTHPHVDQVETGVRAGELLDRRIALGRKEKVSSARFQYLISATAMPTTRQPARGLYDYIAEIDETYDTILTFCMGFPASDFTGCGPVVWAYGDRAEVAVQKYMERAAEPSQWRCDTPAIDDAVARAVSLAALSKKPIVIADTQDNPGAGGTGTTTGALRALIKAGAGKTFPNSVVLGLIWDPDAARKAHAAGVGATVRMSVGKAVQTYDGQSDAPIDASWKVHGLSDGKVVLKGPRRGGYAASVGPTACLELDGVFVIICSSRIAADHVEFFQMVGVEPTSMRILVVKSSNHFRADFEPLVADPLTDIIIAKAKGAFAIDPVDLPWKNLPPEMRLQP